MADMSECTVVIRYRPDSPDGWPWAVSHEAGGRVLTITDLDDSSLGHVLRALAQAGVANGAGDVRAAALARR